MMRNERGIALVITLLIVALLTITVVEFTYSVEVDMHMARNVLNSLQATLLARSGINMGEAFLLHDQEPNVDAFTEEWCPQAGPEAQSCLIDESTSQLVVPENMRLRVQIIDESGKFNVNLTKPNTLQEWQKWHEDPSVPSRLQGRVTLFERLCEARGVDPHLSEPLMDYWGRVFQTVDRNTGGATPGPTRPPATQATPPALNQSQRNLLLQQYDFGSLDDLGVIAGLTPNAINRLRPVLTAVRGGGQVNINTASRTVLSAILDDAEAVDSIISQRQEAPLKDLQLIPRGDGRDQAKAAMSGLLGVRSSLFMIRASAIVNPNPVTGKGGISRSASMLVQRARDARVPANAAPGSVHWTLTRLDWQKEGGAALFRTADQDSGVEEPSAATFPEG